MARTGQTTQKLRPIGDVQVHAQFAFTRVGSVLVMCSQGLREPPETDIDAWLMRLAEPDYTTLLICPRGGNPDARQRARIVSFWDKAERPMPRTAVLTDSALTRSLVVALRWISSFDVRAFAEAEVNDALNFLEEPLEAAERLRDTVTTLHRALETARAEAR